MSDQNKELDKTKFDIGVLGNPPEMLMIAIPVKVYADQGADGLDMFYGKMKRVEAVGSNMIKELFANKKMAGLIKPVTLGVQ